MTPFKLQSRANPMLSKYLADKRKKEIIGMRFGIDDSDVPVGGRCLIYWGAAVYFCIRTSQNYYQSGNLTIPADVDGLEAISIKEFFSFNPLDFEGSK